MSSTERVRADAATADRLTAALYDDPVYLLWHVDVSVDNGVARLGGYVWTPDALYRAQRIARKVPGVTRVENQIELVRPSRRGGSG